MRVRNLSVLIVFVVLAFASTHAGAAQSSGSTKAGQASGTSNELITIDGKKHPEMIPEWSAWQYAINVIDSGVSHAVQVGDREVDSLPTVFYRGGIVEDDIPTLIRHVRSAVADQKRCYDDAFKEHERLMTNKDPLILTKMDDIEMGCRSRTLQARDDILTSLSPQSQALLRKYVEDKKPSMSIVISKSQLARYRLPE